MFIAPAATVLVPSMFVSMSSSANPNTRPPCKSDFFSSHVPFRALFPSLPFLSDRSQLGLTCCGADTIA